MHNPNRVSHRDIGAKLGLHQSTVSRALQDDPRIPAETKRRVRELADELGYRPNTLMSEVAASRWQRAPVGKGTVIAYIDTISSGSYVGGLDMTAAVQAQAAELGYQFAVFRRADFSTSAQLQRVLRSRGITDVIIGPIYKPSLMVELQWEKFISVQLSPGLFRLPLHSVTKDHFNTILLAWQKTISRGYRRIGVVLLNHAVDIIDDVLRRNAVRACQHDLFPHLPRLRPLFYRPESESDRVKAFVRWSKIVEPDAIIGFTNSHYHIFRAEFRREVPYVSLHADPKDTISGIPEDAPTCAREAVNFLHFLRRTYQWGIPQRRIDHVIEPGWFEGKTLPYKAR